MARVCIYCGRELTNGEKCSCRGTASSNSSSSEHRTEKVKSKEKKKEKEKTYRRTTGQRRNFRESFFRLITSRGFNPTDSFLTKIGISLFHSFMRPVTAAEAFIRNNDRSVSIAYTLMFVLSFALGVLRLGPSGIRSFGEGILFGTAAILLLNVLTMLTFRFILKVRYTFMKFLSALSLPAFYMSLFVLIASVGRVTLISFFMTLSVGLIAMVLSHFISLKALSGQSTERLFVNMILVYFILLTITGLVATLAVPPAVISGNII